MSAHAPPHAPDSPRASQSPTPAGLQGDLELELIGLANALYNLGTTVVTDASKERPRPAAANGAPVAAGGAGGGGGGGAAAGAGGGMGGPGAEVGAGKPVGQRVNDVIGHLAAVEEMAGRVPTMIPIQVLSDIDNSRNPMNLTKDRIERAATENQFMNAKIHAISSFCDMLEAALAENFPELREIKAEPQP